VCSWSRTALALKACQQVPGFPVAAAFRQHRTRNLGEIERVIQFSMDQYVGN
jgi:hypothetical protein